MRAPAALLRPLAAVHRFLQEATPVAVQFHVMDLSARSSHCPASPQARRAPVGRDAETLVRRRHARAEHRLAVSLLRGQNIDVSQSFQRCLGTSLDSQLKGTMCARAFKRSVS